MRPTIHPSSRRLGSIRLASVTLCLFLANCGLSGSLQPVPSYDPTIYRLGVEDKLRIVVYGDEQLSRDFSVNESGKLAMPLIGSVDAAGMSTTELAGEIANRLRTQKLLRKPSVSVEVIAFRPISVLGEVVKPGELPYQPGMTMLTAVAGAGGFTYRGVQDEAYVIRQVGASHVVGRLKAEDYVKPGDVIKITERYF